MPAFAFIERIIAPIRRALEGAVRPGPYPLPITGGWLADGGADGIGGKPGSRPRRSRRARWSRVASALTAARSQRVLAPIGGSVEGGGRERVMNSALSRILRSPNDYQTINDFMLAGVHDLYSDGNAYALL